MKTKFEKIMKITSELLSYCHHYGAKEFHFDISEEKDAVALSLQARPEDLSEKELDYLKTALSAPRQREVEQDYWELIGESGNNSELTLIGMLCDDAEVIYENRILTITLKRHD